MIWLEKVLFTELTFVVNWNDQINSFNFKLDENNKNKPTIHRIRLDGSKLTDFKQLSFTKAPAGRLLRSVFLIQVRLDLVF